MRPTARSLAAVAPLPPPTPARALHGFLNVRKPTGLPTRVLSNVVLHLLRHACAVGHVGTLDPFASGTVPLALGAATRLVRFLPNTKAYDARVKLGVSTASGDATGAVTCMSPAGNITLSAAEAAAATLTGALLQTPPSVSAVRHRGERAYKVALREGAGSFVLTARTVRVHAVDVVGGWCAGGDASVAGRSWMPPQVDAAPGAAPAAAAASAAAAAAATPPPPHPPAGCVFPELRLSVSCAGGVYVRSLATSLGAALGVPACLSALARTESNGFRSDAASARDVFDLLRGGGAAVRDALLPSDAPFAHLPAVLALPCAPEALIGEGDSGGRGGGGTGGAAPPLLRPRTGPSRPSIPPDAYVAVRRVTCAAAPSRGPPPAAADGLRATDGGGSPGAHGIAGARPPLAPPRPSAGAAPVAVVAAPPRLTPAEAAVFGRLWTDDTRTGHACVVVDAGTPAPGAREWVTAAGPGAGAGGDGDAASDAGCGGVDDAVGGGGAPPRREPEPEQLHLRLVRVYASLAAEGVPVVGTGPHGDAAATPPTTLTPASVDAAARVVFCGLAVLVPAGFLQAAGSAPAVVRFRGDGGVGTCVPQGYAGPLRPGAVVVAARVVSVIESENLTSR